MQEIQRGTSAPIHLPSYEASSLAQQLDAALVRRLRETIGPARFDRTAQLADWRDGLVAGIDPTLSERTFNGLGRARLVRPENSAAITLNSFLPWLDQLPALHLGDMSGFRELHFDARCPTGIRGTPPHIELVASGPRGVAGVTTRTFGYLNARPARLAAAYAAVQVPRGMSPWLELLQGNGDPAERMRHLDVVALAKQALGLARIFPNRPIRLLYLFLEPSDAERWPVFAAHRAELDRLAERTRDTAVVFNACSFHELWAEWRSSVEPPRLREIAAELSRRYAVTLSTSTGL